MPWPSCNNIPPGRIHTYCPCLCVALGAALSACPCSLLQSHLCTQQTTSGAPSPQQLLSLLGIPSACQDLAYGPSPSCQEGRALHAPWGMYLPQGTHTLSPEASACGVCCNCHITDPLQSHHHLEWPPGDAASPNHQKDSWGSSLYDRGSLPQHPTAWAAKSPITTVLIHSQ